MSKELVIKKCAHCGATVEVLDNCNCKCGFVCCGEEMNTLVPNSVDAAVEKHVPTYEVNGDKVFVKVNHVMDEDHFIEWISLVADDRVCRYVLEPGKQAECHFKYIPGSTLYAYCNKHGLWKADVE